MRCVESVGPAPRAKACAARTRRWGKAAALLSISMLIAGRGVGTAAAADAAQSTGATLHYAPNHNFDASGTWRPAAAGFNLADITDPGQLRDLPVGVKGLVWIGLCAGADRRFVATLTPYTQQKAIFGFYLMDDPIRGSASPNANQARCVRRRTGSTPMSPAR